MNQQFEDFPKMTIAITMGEETVNIEFKPDSDGRMTPSCEVTEFNENSKFSEIIALIIMNALNEIDIQVNIKNDMQNSFEDMLNNYSVNGGTPSAEA